jgi:hypothetical protein
MTREKPILFSGAMIRAILLGAKTQTRRPCKPQPERVDMNVPGVTSGCWGFKLPPISACPFGQVGDQLIAQDASGSVENIKLEITEVRVEALWRMSVEDLFAEGLEPFWDEDADGNRFRDFGAELDEFKEVWDRIYAGRGFGYKQNPYCWCLTFRRTE